jgi:UDP-N-acetylmuramoylalanine--D-glutamate ligase
MIPAAWRAGEIAVIGLGKSGRSVSALLRREGLRVYVSDAGKGPSLDETAATLRGMGADVDVGSHDLARIARATLVVASPGVPPTAPPLAAARAAGVLIVGEIEIALHFLPKTKSIAVTGTNGKTTTTALIGHLLRTLGEDAVDAGNIGTPLAEVALREKHPAWTALELSSFQLHDTPSIRPDVGVVTNLGPDHLDRYASADDYYADKARLMANADAGSKWVLNGDDAEVLALHRRLPGVSKTAKLAGQQWTFSLKDSNASAWFDRGKDMLIALGAPLIPRKELALFGDHNVANTLAAALAVMVGDRRRQNPRARMAIAAGIRSFRALKHRLEVAGEPGGVLWINDSKATNVGSTLVAVQGMTRPTILLLGGRHKGEPYTALAEPLRRIGKTVLAYGESAPIIEQDLGGLVPIERLGSSFPDVIARARALAKPGDVVLLSPACSSYDMFNNYEERGAEFKRLALATT